MRFSLCLFFHVKSKHCYVITQLEARMTKTQLKTLATQIHGLAVKSANGKKTVQNKALEKIATLLNQAIEAEIKQAYASIASQVRGLAEKLEPKSARRAVGRKKVSRKKPVATKKKPPVRRGRVKPTEKAAESTETTTL
jgi:hypothetical protein